MSFTILKPGLFTTIQDSGRSSVDLPTSGVMDRDSYKLANYLVGNDPREALLEITLSGPMIQFLDSTVIAVTGAPFDVTLNGNVLAMNQSASVQKGDVLSIKGTSVGARSYLAVAGNWGIAPVFQSKSTDTINSIGGYNGRALEKGDHIRVTNNPEEHRLIGIERSVGQAHVELDAYPGPELEMLTPSSQELLFRTSFSVSNDSNRMGIRSLGTSILKSELNQIISSPVFTGVVQLPNNGLPIILMSDAPTTGGYPRVLVLDEAVCNKVAQLKPGDTFTFKLIEYINPSCYLIN
jgi:antagonist of KipI